MTSLSITAKLLINCVVVGSITGLTGMWSSRQMALPIGTQRFINQDYAYSMNVNQRIVEFRWKAPSELSDGSYQVMRIREGFEPEFTTVATITVRDEVTNGVTRITDVPESVGAYRYLVMHFDTKGGMRLIAQDIAVIRRTPFM